MVRFQSDLECQRRPSIQNLIPVSPSREITGNLSPHVSRERSQLCFGVWGLVMTALIEDALGGELVKYRRILIWTCQTRNLSCGPNM
jgi:hypothetical protein